MARFEDMTRSDLAVNVWTWMDEEYAELAEQRGGDGDIEGRGRCQAYSRMLQFLLDIDHEEVKHRTRDRYERAS